MHINTKQLARTTVVEVTGRVDHSTASDLARTLAELIGRQQRNLVVDLSGVDYVSSAGLKALLTAHKETTNKHNGDVRLAGLQPQVSETIRTVGFDKIFRIYPTPVEAVGSF